MLYESSQSTVLHLYKKHPCCRMMQFGQTQQLGVQAALRMQACKRLVFERLPDTDIMANRSTSQVKAVSHLFKVPQSLAQPGLIIIHSHFYVSHMAMHSRTACS